MRWATVFSAALSEWHEDARCRVEGMPEWWFPEKDTAEGRQARAICRSCPVIAQCLSWAVANDVRWGIWGGMDHRQRRELRRRTIRTGYRDAPTDGEPFAGAPLARRGAPTPLTPPEKRSAAR